MKKILLSCACCLLAVGLLAGCDNEEEDVTPDEPDTTVPSTGGDDGGSTDGGEGGTKEMVFGFEVDGVMNYIDGGTISGYAYEGTLTTDLAKAVRITLEESETEGAYYVSFDNGGTTNWITITTGNYTNLSYSTEKALLYYNAEYDCWGNETLDYFLCYNSAYECFYCSALSSYGPDSTKPSPIATLYYTDGSVVSGLKGYTYSAPAPTEITISGLSYVLVDGTTQLTASVNAGADSSVVWSIAGPEGVATDAATISETGLVTGVSAAEGLVVTATSAIDANVSGSFTISVIAVALPVTSGDEASTTYKLGALDTDEYVYRWFTGETTGSTFLLAGDSYDAAADIYRTEQNIPNVSYAYTLSLMVEDELVYISNSGSSTSVTLSSSPCIWVYNEELSVYAQGSESGRSLVLYTSKITDKETEEVLSVTYSFRAYNQTDTNLAYPHAALYEEEAVVATVSGITITAEDEATSVEVGKTLQLTATVSPEDADPRVTWSVEEGYKEYATVDENGLVTGVAVCESVTITATSVSDSTKSGQITIVVTEVEPLPEGMIGYFDFSTNTANGTGISASTDLDSFYTGVSGTYLGIRDYNTVYLGNGGSGAFENVTTCIKFGSGSGNGTLQLKFALGTSIEKVVVTAHSWNKVSMDYPDTESNQLVINGDSKDCSVSGTAEELTYEITDNLTYLLTFESVGRVTIHSIEIYGTTGNSYDVVSSITLTAENSNLTEYESTQITVSYLPDTALLDIDTLTWSSTDSSVAKVTQNLNGAVVEALASTESVTITAEAENGVKGELTFAISAVDPTAPITTTITYETIMGLDQFSNITWGSSQTCFSSTDGVVTTFHGCTVTWYTGTEDGASSNGCAIFSGSSLRIYKYAHFNISAEEGYTISSVVLTTSNVGMFNVTVDGSTTTASNSPVTVTPTTNSEVIFTHNGGSNTPVITSIVIVATPVAS